MDLIISNASGKPIYEQIYTQIKNCILSGELSPGDALPGKGCYVAEQNLELVREAHLKQIEDHMGEIVSLAQGCSLTEEEAVRMLRLMWKMKGSDTE